MAADGEVRSRRSRPTTRLAALAFLPIPLVPLVWGALTLLTPRSVAPDCFEYCDLDRAFAPIWVAVGMIGVLIAVGIWTHRVSAMALGLLVSALATLIVAVIAGGALLTAWSIGPDPLRLWPFVVALIFFGTTAALLVAALYGEADAAAIAVGEGPSATGPE